MNRWTAERLCDPSFIPCTFVSKLELEAAGKLLEAQRLAQRTKYDLEMLEETGFVKGIENYSRYVCIRSS